MKQAFHTLTVPTKGPGLYEFTDDAAAFVRGEKIADGLLTCFVRHTSASLVIQENADPDVQKGEERFAKQTQWSSGPLRATNAASLGERRGVSAGSNSLRAVPASRRAEMRAAAAFAGAKGPLDLSLIPAHPGRGFIYSNIATRRTGAR